MRLFTIPLVLFPLVGFFPALAQQNPGSGSTTVMPSLWKTFFDISRWVEGFKADIANLGGSVQTLALALIMLGFVYGIVQGIVGGGLEAIKGTFVRMAVVTLLYSLWSSGVVKSTLNDAMAAARNWGIRSTKATLYAAGGDLSGLAVRIVPFYGTVTAIKVVSTRIALSSTKLGSKMIAGGVSAASTKVLQYLNWASLLLIPMMLFFFIISVVATFTVEVGIALFPLAVAMLIFPRASAVDWFSRWVSTVMGALLLLILMPIGFKAAVDVGIHRPVRQVNAYIDEAKRAIYTRKDMVVAAIKEDAKSCAFYEVGCQLLHKVNEVWEEIKAFGAEVGVYIKAWFMGVILLLMGMGAAGYIMFNVERVAISYIGGFVASGVRGLLGQAGVGGGGGSYGRTSAGPGAASAVGSGKIPSSSSGASERLPSPRPIAYEVADAKREPEKEKKEPKIIRFVA